MEPANRVERKNGQNPGRPKRRSGKFRTHEKRGARKRA